jgi:transcription elongation factor Elf1
MRLLHFNAEDKRRIDMAKKIDRAWKYFKCQKCGKEGLTDSVNGVIG